MSNNPPFKNIYDSGIIDIWFSALTNSLLTSAAIVVAVRGSLLAWMVAYISYMFLATQLTHGTRQPYEYLKGEYVYPTTGKLKRFVFYTILLFARIHLMAIPILIFWWAYGENEVLF